MQLVLLVYWVSLVHKEHKELLGLQDRRALRVQLVLPVLLVPLVHLERQDHKDQGVMLDHLA